MCQVLFLRFWFCCPVQPGFKITGLHCIGRNNVLPCNDFQFYMFAADEMLGTGGTPCDLSYCGIKLHVQNAVHMFSIFRITARGFFSYLCIYSLDYSRCLLFFQHVFHFWQTFKSLLIACFCVIVLLILSSALCRHLH